MGWEGFTIEGLRDQGVKGFRKFGKRKAERVDGG
jgi:hypothetical protein